MQILQALPLARKLVRQADDHKGDSGRVVLIGGAPSMAGALVLAGQGALYSGAGYGLLMMLDPASAHVLPAQPELMVHDAALWEPAHAFVSLRPDAVAIGPGLGRSAVAVQWLRVALAWEGPLVVDADAIQLVADHPVLLEALRARQHPATLTPHPGEAARLLQTDVAGVQADRHSAIRRLVLHTRSIVVLKGRHTLLAAPDNPIEQCADGNPGMAVAGMGDVLTGCIAALAAQGVRKQLSLWQATCLGVQLHAQAADQLVQSGVGPIGLTPMELAAQLRATLNRAAQCQG